MSIKKPITGEIKYLLPHLRHAISGKTPVSALKEYLSNSIDAYADEIGIFVSPERKMVLIQDNGIGMSYDDIERVVDKLGNSIKRSLQGTIGEKALGLQHFPATGAEKIQIFSRKKGEKSYNFLEMNDKEFDAELDKDITHAPLFEFENGTRIMLMGIDPQFIEKNFYPKKIKNEIGEIYSPLLRDGRLDIKIGYLNAKRISYSAESKQYRGEKVLEEILGCPFSARDEFGHIEQKNGKIELYLFIDPEQADGKVMHYNHGVKVLDSIVSLNELNPEIWGNGKLFGEINEDFLRLNTPRDAPIRSFSGYMPFIQTLKNYETYLGEKLRTITARDIDKSELARFGEGYLRILDAVARDSIMDISTLVRGKEGDSRQRVVEGVKNGGSTNFGGTREVVPPQTEGRDTVKPNNQGDTDYVRRARKIISSHYIINYVDFNDLTKINLRSELVEGYKYNINVNTHHPDYLFSKKNKRERNKYLAYLISKEVAYGEFKETVRKASQNDIINTNTVMTLAHDILTELAAEFYIKGTRAAHLSK